MFKNDHVLIRKIFFIVIWSTTAWQSVFSRKSFYEMITHQRTMITRNLLKNGSPRAHYVVVETSPDNLAPQRILINRPITRYYASSLFDHVFPLRPRPWKIYTRLICKWPGQDKRKRKWGRQKRTRLKNVNHTKNGFFCGKGKNLFFGHKNDNLVRE